MIAPFVQVQISVTEPGRQIQQGYSVTPLETLAELFGRIAREHQLSGPQAEWVFQFNGQPQTWASTVGEVARYAGDPALLVLTLVRVGLKREQAEGAGGDWGETAAAPRPNPHGEPAEDVDWDALAGLGAPATGSDVQSNPADREPDDEFELSLDVVVKTTPAPMPPPVKSAPSGGFAGPVPRAPAPTTLPSVVSGSRRERAESVVLRDEMPKRKRASDVEDDDRADDAMQLRAVTRQAAVRYYHRMNPQRVYPFLVVLSAEEIAEIVQKGVKQAAGDRFTAGTESPVEIEPVLPGCQCYPPRHTLIIGPQTQTLEFWVVPQVLGTVRGAKVIVRQDGDTLSEVKLEAKVVKQTAAVIVGIMSFVMPYVTKGLKSDDPDGTRVQTALNWVSTNLRPEFIFVGLALVAVGLYFWARPRKRDQFWDVTPKG